jgi:hypothetical protein
MHPLLQYKDEIARLVSEKYSAAQIAEALTKQGVDTNKNRLIGFCHRYDVPLRPRNGRVVERTGPERLNDARDNILERYAKAENKPRMVSILSAKYHVKPSLVREFLRNNGLALSTREKRRVKSAIPFVEQQTLPADRVGVPFLDAGRLQCRYPLWGLEDRIGNVCGEPVAKRICKDGSELDLSWCPSCLSRVSRPVKLAA